MSLPPVDVVAQARRRRDEELGPAGWLRRFTASPPRLIEIRDLYESLGHEVLLDPLTPGELAAECEGCILALSVFRVVYTRAVTGGSAGPGAGHGVEGAAGEQRTPGSPEPAQESRSNPGVGSVEEGICASAGHDRTDPRRTG